MSAPASNQYQLLEPTFSEAVGANKLNTNISDSSSLLASTSFIYTLLITACVAATAFIYVKGGILRMQATTNSISKSNEEFKRATLGLLGVLSLFLVLSTLNRDLLTGDVGLSKLRVDGSSASISTGASQSNSGSGGSSKACAPEADVKAALASGNICGNTACSALNGCNYQQYLPIIQSEASKNGVDPKMLIVIMCRESKAKKTEEHTNPDGSVDCGLMQINQRPSCNSNILDPATNIAMGASLLKQKMNATSQVYPGVPAEAGVFSSYNCCSNKTVPNSPSNDCNQSSGYPSSIPKWACPINPGNSGFNMCAVKDYACDLTACLKSL